ncbi:hypothetical protein ACIQZI_16030 [Peribacillus sp. NPDC096379]|uniref:hypothetical protein n=1 Tax=Peribacillus sp. NPDC096379 TaxID=3364393 RepID=UPI00380EF686
MKKRDIKGNKKVECFFIDQCGNETNRCFNEVIECEEVLGVSGRTNRKVILLSGKTMLLQKVNLRKKDMFVSNMMMTTVIQGRFLFYLKKVFSCVHQLVQQLSV